MFDHLSAQHPQSPKLWWCELPATIQIRLGFRVSRHECFIPTPGCHKLNFAGPRPDVKPQDLDSQPQPINYSEAAVQSYTRVLRPSSADNLSASLHRFIWFSDPILSSQRGVRYPADQSLKLLDPRHNKSPQTQHPMPQPRISNEI